MKKTKVKLFTSIVVGTLLLSGVVQGRSLITNVTSTIDEQITMKWNGEKFTPKEDNGEAVHPIVYKGRTYLPVRFIAEKAGVNVGWDGTNRTVIFNQDSNNSVNDNSNNNITNKNKELEKQVESLKKENVDLKSQNKDADYIEQIRILERDINTLKQQNNRYKDREKQQAESREKSKKQKEEAEKSKAKSQKLIDEMTERRKEYEEKYSINEVDSPKPIPREPDQIYINGKGTVTPGTNRPSTRGGWYVNGFGQRVWKEY